MPVRNWASPLPNDQSSSVFSTKLTITSVGGTPHLAPRSAIEVGFLLGGSRSGGDLDQNHLVGPLEAETGVFYADAAFLVLVDDLIAVAQGYMERVQHGLVGDVEQRGEFLLATAFDDVEAEKGHRSVPLC